MSRVRELFSFSVEREDVNWKSLLRKQQCRYSCKRCFKVRKSQALIGDSMHFHSYKLKKDGADYKLVLDSRCSTDSSGISILLGLKVEANIGFEGIAKILESKISDKTVFAIG